MSKSAASSGAPGGPDGPGGGTGLFETTRIELAAASIAISSPSTEVVGSTFRVSGSATVRMRTTTFIKAGGQGHTTVFDTFVTDGFTVAVAVGNEQHRAKVSEDGDRISWSHQVDQDLTGKVAITATLDGTVRVGSTKTVGGQTQSHFDTVRVQRTDSATVTVDVDAPELSVTSLDTSVGPPYQLTLEGTAEDRAGVQSVRWRLGLLSRTAESLSGDWSRWRAMVPLPDRLSEHRITITALDRVGHASARTVVVGPDQTPPVLALTEPSVNPHRVLWQEGGVSVQVRGMAGDTESKVAVVQWRQDGGDVTDAEETNANWLTWQLIASIATPGAHTVEVWAVDMAGNESAHHMLQINVQVEG